jgi:diguanylate cyclase (GGDEF)-like protein
LIGTSSFAWVHPDDLDRARGFHAEAVTATGTSRAVEYRVRHADGLWHHVEAIGNNLLDDPSVRGVVLNARDISERKQAEDQLAYQAFHDPLTDLPNRALFMDRLEQALERSSRRQEITAVLFLDLDRFKVVNDSLGHEAGDQLLVVAGRRLLACLRPGDTAARLGGDEFTLLLEGVADEVEAVRVAERVAAEFEPAIDVGGRSVFVTTSIGIALSKPSHQRPADLLREADIAMYQAKARGKASYALFDAEMGSSALRRLELETDLRRAIDREQLRVEYQPVIDLVEGKVVAMEALVRWQHPERGFVPPVEFISLAEETGLILPLGRWVLEQACRQARIWHEQHGADTPSVSVNLSAKQFQHPDILEDVARTLRAAGLPASILTLEITETVVMEDAESNSATLRSFKELGVKLAIDDFGSGYSSLGYLKRFPVDMLKIDRTFVGGLGRDPEDTAIVEAVISLSHTLGMRVTAEGVETSQQLSQLQVLGCDLGQGYYFSASTAAQAAETFIRQQPWVAACGLALAATA